MQLFEVDIDVKNPGLLEVPAGKEVDQLPKSHFEKLIAKKGYEKIIRGLTNLEVWNKNKNPKLSKWASDMADKLKEKNEAKNRRDLIDYSKLKESYSARLYEANIGLAKKLGTKTVAGLKKAGQYAKETATKSADTARNAIVAGAVAPVGAGIAQKYTNPDKKKDKKYSAAETAAIATAMKSKATTESLSKKLLEKLAILEEKEKSSRKTIAKGAAAGTVAGGVGGAVGLGKVANHLTGGLKGTVTPGVGGALIKGTRTLAKVAGGVRGATTGLVAGTALGAGKAIHDKVKSNKKQNANESLIEALNRLKQIVEEEGIPKKKRILSPEQKARRQERRKLRRELEKQGLYTPKHRSGKVTTTQGVQKIDPTALKKAQDQIAANKANPKPASSGPLKLQSKPDPVKPQTSIPSQPNASQDLAKKMTSTADKLKRDTAKKVKSAKKVFGKSSTFRKIVNKAGRVGAMKGAAATAAVGAGLYGAKKMLDKNKKK